MKILSCLLFLFLISSIVSAQEKFFAEHYVPTSGDQIVLMDSSINLYKAGDLYISGQPNDSIFSALKDLGLDLVVNVRTPEEMEALKKDGFDERMLLDSLRIPYVNVPIGGSAGFTKEAIENINNAISANPGNIMIHCRSAGRASNAWVAWLINYQQLRVDEAIALGKQMQLRFYLEDLLGYELSYDKK